MTATALERLPDRRVAIGAPLRLGIDPPPDQLPAELSRDVAGVEACARGPIESAGPEAVAVKTNVAFSEAFGSAGWAALERFRGDVPREPICSLDAKRGDIATTAERYAAG